MYALLDHHHNLPPHFDVYIFGVSMRPHMQMGTGLVFLIVNGISF